MYQGTIFPQELSCCSCGAAAVVYNGCCFAAIVASDTPIKPEVTPDRGVYRKKKAVPAELACAGMAIAVSHSPEMNVENADSDANGERHNDHGEQDILAQEGNGEGGGGNNFGQQEEEHGQRHENATAQ
jgi:hypothetical protein